MIKRVNICEILRLVPTTYHMRVISYWHSCYYLNSQHLHIRDSIRGHVEHQSLTGEAQSPKSSFFLQSHHRCPLISWVQIAALSMEGERDEEEGTKDKPPTTKFIFSDSLLCPVVNILFMSFSETVQVSVEFLPISLDD